MIYLIRTKYEKISLLKIGYTEDSKKKSRYTNYRLHNPLFELLYEIPEGTEECEKLLQLYFSEFQYKDYGNEWFYESQDIIDYFETHRTSESLGDLQESGLVIDRAKFYQFRDFVEKIINLVVNKKVDLGEISLGDGVNQVSNLVNNVLVIRHIRSYSRFWKYIEDVFGYKESDLLGQEYLDSIQKFLTKFDSLNFFTDKMKALCESDLTPQEISTVLELIPIDYKNYYITLGKEKIRSLSYQKSKLKLESENQMNNQLSSDDLLNLIYSSFVIGNKYTKPHIKKVLADIYSSLNISTTPKAIDLEKYFELKLVDVVDEFGKRTKGFKLINKKL